MSKYSAIISLLFIALSTSGCFHAEFRHNGVILDSDSGKPISNAMVSLSMDYACILPLNPGGPGSNFLANIENMSDSKGSYLLPFQFYFLRTLLCGTDSDLNIIKAGYFPARIVSPSSHNDIRLYPIKYYIDYLDNKKAAERGEINPPYFDHNQSDFKKYQAELNNMAAMQFRRVGEDGEFLNIPDAQLTDLKCTSDFIWNATSNLNESAITFGIDGIVCTVFDKANDKQYAFDSRGKVIFLDSLEGASKRAEWSFGYGGIICAPNDRTGKWVVFNSSGKISDSYAFCLPPISSENISVSVEDKHTLCVTKVYIGGNKFCTNFTDEIESIKIFAGNFFIKFQDGKIKKYSSGNQDGPLKEVVSFYNNATVFLRSKSINSFAVGRSTSTRALYMTDAGSRIYRLDLDGNPDCRIDVSTTQFDSQ